MTPKGSRTEAGLITRGEPALQPTGVLNSLFPVQEMGTLCVQTRTTPALVLRGFQGFEQARFQE